MFSPVLSSDFVPLLSERVTLHYNTNNTMQNVRGRLFTGKSTAMSTNRFTIATSRSKEELGDLQTWVLRAGLNAGPDSE